MFLEKVRLEKKLLSKGLMLRLAKKYRSEPKPERLSKFGFAIVVGLFISLILVWEMLFRSKLKEKIFYQNEFYSSPSQNDWYAKKPDVIEKKIEKVIEIKEVQPVISQKVELTKPNFDQIFSRGISVNTKLSKKAGSFLESKDFAAAENSDVAESSYVDLKSRFELKAGSVIPALLLTSINSDLEGELLAQVREDVFDSVSGNYLLIPKGTKIFGKYDSAINYGQERLFVSWSRLIFANGASLTLNDMSGVDASGSAGFNAEVNNRYGRLFTNAILMSLITAGVQLSQPQESRTGDGASVGQTLAASLGQNIGEVSAQVTRKNLNIQPTLEQQYGYRFNVMVNQDLVFPGEYNQIDIL